MVRVAITIEIFILSVLSSVPHLYIDESFLAWRLYVPVSYFSTYHYLMQQEPRNVSRFFFLFFRVFIFFRPSMGSSPQLPYLKKPTVSKRDVDAKTNNMPTHLLSLFI